MTLIFKENIDENIKNIIQEEAKRFEEAYKESGMLRALRFIFYCENSKYLIDVV